jgi:predicted lipid-binding transport protein (Tim44 family)
MPPVQLIELLIFAVLAAVVLYNLYAVLGRRIGRQPGEAAAPATAGAPADNRAQRAQPPGADVELTGLAALAARDPGFDAAKFLQGAQAAYQMIVRAFAAGDRATLKGLLSPQVMAGWERAMAEREAQGRTESAEFQHLPRADIETGEVEGDVARIKVRFLAEFTSRVRAAEGAETSEERRTAEAWTFERPLAARDPNWTLVRVDAAEA